MEVLTKILSWVTGLFLVLLMIFLLSDIVIISLPELSLDYLLDVPLSAGRKGGIFPIIVSTILILLICLAFVIPIGLGSALFLSEYTQSSNSSITLIKKSIDVLAAVPSIVFGLFGNAIFCVFFKMGFSILSGGLTLALMALPLFISTVEKGFSSTPSNYRLVGRSLGISKFTMIKSIIIPYALPSIFVGTVLSIGRALAETAALIFTSGYVDRLPESIFDSGRALSIHIYDLSMNVPGGDINAYKSAFVLISLIILSNTTINIILNKWYRKRIAL